MLSNENKQILIQHLKSLGFNVGFMLLAVLADFAAKNLGLFQLGTTQAAFIGVILAQVSNWANSQFTIAGRVASYFRKGHRG